MANIPQTFMKIGAVRFEISWRQTKKQTSRQTDRHTHTDRHTGTQTHSSKHKLLAEVNIKVSLVHKISCPVSASLTT